MTEREVKITITVDTGLTDDMLHMYLADVLDDALFVWRVIETPGSPQHLADKCNCSPGCECLTPNCAICACD